MGKRILSLFLTVVMVFTMLFTLLPVTAYADEPIPGGASGFAGGDGTEYDPYLIETAEQLNNVRNFLGEAYRYTYFKLNATISLSAYPNWEPIGNEDNPFYGRFYSGSYFIGSDFQITDLTINRPDESYVGLFGCCGDAMFANLTIEGANVAGGPKTGILAGALGHKIPEEQGRVYTGKIDKCSSTGSVISSTQPANGRVGGLVGELIKTTSIINSNSTASVTGTGSVGGVAGYVADGGEVKDCYSAGSVTGSHYTGGVAGYVDGGGTVQDCYATGSVTGNESVGGVVGFVNTNGVVRRCAALNSSVSGTYDVGGVAGTVEEGTVEHCYATCSVTGSYYVGGVVGHAFNFDYLLCCYATGSVTGQYSVGGVVGSVEYVTVNGCAALNPSVSGRSNVGRVAGYGSNVTFQYNWAFSGMTVTVDGTVTPITGGAADNISGANKTAAEIKADGTLGSRFREFEGWTTANGKLPGFGAAVDMPAHIVDTITTTSLPGGTVGIAYSQTLAATGGMPITWTIDSGDLPNGLSLSGNTISGTPGAAGTFDFTIKAENAEGSDTKALEIVIGSAPPVGTAPAITTTSLPDGTVGIAYSQTLAATGDTPITWSIVSGDLPGGLSLSGNTISGTPGAAGTFDFTIKAENAEGDDTMALEIVIGSTPPVGTAPAITTTFLPDGRVGSSYSRSLSAAGDTPITWTIDGGSLPNGLTLGGSTGVISGTPTARGNFSFTVKATNAVGSVTKELSITINAASTGGGSGGGSSGGGGSTSSTDRLEIPSSFISDPNSGKTLTLENDFASVTISSNMLDNIPGIAGKKAEISTGQGDKSRLPDEVKAAIGDRPLISLSLFIDGKQTDWSNPSAPVTVSIPYTPTAAELANPESIVVWYIDGSGNAVSVPNGRYNPATGTVSFFTTHFSDYAVAYVHKTFSDLGGVEWARKAIEVMASKGITNGTGDGTTFSPGVNITRADFMVLLIKTLGLTAEFTENFDDVKPDAYYYNAVGVAKKLGIAAGSGNNLFKPTESISRQDMMVLAARALEKYQALKTADTNTVLERFSDRKDIAEYAASSLATLIEAGLIKGSGSKLTPRAYTTRAEVAAFLYKIYNKYPELR